MYQCLHIKHLQNYYQKSLQFNFYPQQNTLIFRKHYHLSEIQHHSKLPHLQMTISMIKNQYYQNSCYHLFLISCQLKYNGVVKINVLLYARIRYEFLHLLNEIILILTAHLLYCFVITSYIAFDRLILQILARCPFIMQSSCFYFIM